MNIIELIGIIVGSIATILGGVWFMLYKAFNLGKVSHRMEEIEKKTSNADCKTHKESIEKIKEHNLNMFLIDCEYTFDRNKRRIS